MQTTDYYTLNQTNMEESIRKYVPLVKKIALHLISRLPSHIQLDDLIQGGMIGLLESLRKHDPSLGARFETYAKIRIRGAMIEEIRKSDWTPRSLIKKHKKISDTIHDIESKTGKPANDMEIATKLGMSLDKYYKILQEASTSNILSFSRDDGSNMDISDVNINGQSRNPERLTQDRERVSLTATAISKLPEREKLVISLYYTEELNLKEIGEILEVSESRVSQIRTQALLRLRNLLST